jgi:hypothetical protein
MPTVRSGRVDRPAGADDQLTRQRDRSGQGGVPVIGAGPGAIRHTLPESCLDSRNELRKV